MKAPTTVLIHDLKELTSKHQTQLIELEKLSDHQLSLSPNPDAWNVLECIEHLNRYGRFYLPEVRSRLTKAQSAPSTNFKSSWLGNYFAESMKPGTKAMKTFKEMNPKSTLLGRGVLNEFATQLEEWQELLSQAKDFNLSKVKTFISISKIIKLRLGDTLRVVIYHNDRHILQANNAAVKSQNPRHSIPL